MSTGFDTPEKNILFDVKVIVNHSKEEINDY